VQGKRMESEGPLVPDVLTSLAGSGVLLMGGGEPKGFMQTLPDPMQVDPVSLVFVVALVTALFIFLKFVFFKPIIKVMDDREEAIQSGANRRAEAAALVERRQGDYAARLKDLRTRAFEHRKALAAAATQERQALLEKARQEATGRRTQALAELQTARAAARADLMAQVDALADSMVAHLLREA